MEKHIQYLSKRCRKCGQYNSDLRFANIRKNVEKFQNIFSNDTVEMQPPIKFCQACKKYLNKITNLRGTKCDEFLLELKNSLFIFQEHDESCDCAAEEMSTVDDTGGGSESEEERA